MDLLKDKWIPVRALSGDPVDWISLSELLTSEEQYQLSLPRDDMELAALQMLICLVQVGWMPDTLKKLGQRIGQPLTLEQYEQGVEPLKDWFKLDHPETPFMQVKNVKAKDVTPMDKLLAGLTGATNSCFVNEPDLAAGVCAGCSAIALYNQANNAPSFGGGFKAGLRGGAPITTLIQGRHLRETVWLNVMAADQLPPEWFESPRHSPTWVDPIQEKSTISWSSIGFLRGLFWQPAHIELCPPQVQVQGQCRCCGRNNVALYQGFLKAKFNYTIDGLWPHPHSPRLISFKQTGNEKKFAAFTTSAPTWTRLTSFVVQQQVDKQVKEGSEPAAVVLQAGKLVGGGNKEKLRLIVGGYRNNQASILERRHEMLELNTSWQQHPACIKELVDIGLGFKSALRKSLYLFAKGVSEVKGAGVLVQELGERQFYRYTDDLMQSTLANAHFEDSEQLSRDIQHLCKKLKSLCLQLFEQETSPYLHDPQLIHTLAVARRTLNKHIKELMPLEKESTDG